ncbi:3'(2'),5'-bisphosphate nucleotidase CysQ [Reichenbachiella carrageenanivorans]|uniref:3'(2'),5'-bisphosphate nucleotidase CysQ n=1 Tax=Reichenbachiella carrageenanivorans TaxID=2979869 RepID=A0ABY6D373_9BACT|nr:3'(2'),5'-bisphosphate nucleotidase CysQ [Reichenbachiella carrageenanivorans]UXX80611.1 3'(2'),5'-bisphosphate nucleotidase CysQ [Reichenbachiella carrageenanivorans]
MNLSPLLEVAKVAAKNAAVEILEIYESGDFSIEAKADESPLTKADQASHLAIVAELEKTNLPILSEEGRDIPYEERKDWGYFWMIDPLDGTKEFIKRNGEFTVNIALIHQGAPILGVVQVPVQDKLYFASQDQGAFLEDAAGTEKITVNNCRQTDTGIRVVASRSHLNEDTQHFMDQLNDPEIVSMGSSLKLLAIAEGQADLYPRFAPTMEWDTAAAHAVVSEAGGKVLIKDSESPVIYNKPNLLNPHFLVTCQLGD